MLFTFITDVSRPRNHPFWQFLTKNCPNILAPPFTSVSIILYRLVFFSLKFTTFIIITDILITLVIQLVKPTDRIYNTMPANRKISNLAVWEAIFYLERRNIIFASSTDDSATFWNTLLQLKDVFSQKIRILHQIIWIDIAYTVWIFPLSAFLAGDVLSYRAMEISLDILGRLYSHVFIATGTEVVPGIRFFAT